MSKKLELHEARLFPADPSARSVALNLYQAVKDLPIISPHGHTDPSWFSGNEPFTNATDLLLVPDHYLYRMLYSQGITLDALSIPQRDGQRAGIDPREAWRLFASHFYLFRGTPSSMWLNHTFATVFGLDKQLGADTADEYFDHINACLAREDFRPRALFERFRIALLATTESPIDTLSHHEAIRASGWKGNVVTAYRPDIVVDPDHESFHDGLKRFAEITGEDTLSWNGYLNAHRKRRQDFIKVGATSTDHGHPSAATADLSPADAEKLFQRVISKRMEPGDAELFRAQMLTEMAGMSIEDGLVLQIHPGALRNHNQWLFERYGRDKGADMPMSTEYIQALKPLLDRYGNDTRLSVILFTLDETVYSRELAPLAGHYPVLKLGPSWWFHDSPEGMRRFREQITETAGFYNTVGFNDDTRAFMSIPARHDVARRVDCGFLGRLVAEHRLDEDEALQVALDLAYNLPRKAYKLESLIPPLEA